MVEVPEILKGQAQITFMDDSNINIMNMETYVSMDVEWPTDEDLVKKLKDLQTDPDRLAMAKVEFWELAGKTLINRIFQE